MKILLIEDDKFYAKQVKSTLYKEFGYQITHIESRREFEEIKNSVFDYDLILYDVYLPDCDACDFIDELTQYSKPIIVITASESTELFDFYSKKRIADFIIKSDMVRLDYLVMKLKIFEFTKKNKILVLEDMKSHFLYIKNFFRIYYPFATLLHAKTIQEGLDFLEKENIKLVLCDYILENESGITFVKKVREKYGLNEVAIIALTGTQEKGALFRFLKSGANDFMQKKFDNLTFVTKFDTVLTNVILFDEIKNFAYRDYLTKCYTRRYLFEEGIKLWKSFRRAALPCSIAMCDLDHFKKINDTYGHDAGDLVLKDFATILLHSVRENDFVVRMGGEEFLLFFGSCDKEMARNIIEHRIRREIQKRSVHYEGQDIRYNFSCGICDSGDTLEELIKRADEKLYQAKKQRGITIA